MSDFVECVVFGAGDGFFGGAEGDLVCGDGETGGEYGCDQEDGWESCQLHFRVEVGCNAGKPLI